MGLLSQLALSHSKIIYQHAQEENLHGSNIQYSQYFGVGSEESHQTPIHEPADEHQLVETAEEQHVDPNAAHQEVEQHIIDYYVSLIFVFYC